MYESPLYFISVLIVISVFLLSYALFLAEMPMTLKENAELLVGGSSDFSSFSNAIWCVILTLTTVGYGDIYPKTDIGRSIVIFICIWGIFIISIMVVTMTNSMELKDSHLSSLKNY